MIIFMGPWPKTVRRRNGLYVVGTFYTFCHAGDGTGIHLSAYTRFAAWPRREPVGTKWKWWALHNKIMSISRQHPELERYSALTARCPRSRRWARRATRSLSRPGKPSL